MEHSASLRIRHESQAMSHPPPKRFLCINVTNFRRALDLTRVYAILSLLGTLSACFSGMSVSSAQAADEVSKSPSKRVAAVVTLYRRDSHADVIVSRLLEGYSLD